MSRTFRYTSPPPPQSATGRVAEVYRQLGEDFGIERAATFVVLASAPELLAPAWALMRESLIAGAGTRTDRELVAAGVSLANRCPFCVDAHTMLLHATGDHALAESLARGEAPSDERHARVLDWGRATRTPGSPGLTPLPFPSAEVPAQLGTAFAFHFINRVVSALLTENLLPCNAQRLRPVRSLGGRSLARTVRRDHVPGASLALLDDPGPGPAWAGQARLWARRTPRCWRPRPRARDCSTTSISRWSRKPSPPGTARIRRSRGTSCPTANGGPGRAWRCWPLSPRTASPTRTWRPGSSRPSPITVWSI